VVKLTIDGHEIEAEKGTTLLKAAESIGIAIPTFCFHDGLSVPANCRMCLVNTNKSPKMLPACYSTVMDGMEVWTEDDRTKKTRASTLEFILLHHPVDCPICDQAGECELQDHYFNYSASASRLFTKKNHKPKAVRVGPHVVLDAERCIVCTRCIRFCDEVTETSELQVIHRGERSEISTFPGRTLDNAYSVCTADICPVGALTSADFRFKRRVWFLKTASSVCSGCSRGCNIYTDYFESEIQRYRPRYNADVNQWWMCDEGRLTYKEFQTDRVIDASVDGTNVGGPEALEAAITRLGAFGETPGFESLAVVPSLLSTNEDLYTLRQVAQAVGASTWYEGGRANGESDNLLIQGDKNPNRTGLKTLLGAASITAKPLSDLAADINSGSIQGVLWIGHEHAVDDGLAQALGGLQLRIAMVSNAGAGSNGAHVVLPIRTFEEVDGTWTQFEGRVQRLCKGPGGPVGVTSLWDLVAQLGRALRPDAELPTRAGARAIFGELKEAVPAFQEASYASPPPPPALYKTLPNPRRATA
jgi:NADH-quinone oxidoreductase subunit G